MNTNIEDEHASFTVPEVRQVQQTETTRANHYTERKVTRVGEPVNGNDDIITAGEWGNFDKNEKRFTKMPTPFTLNCFRDLLRVGAWLGCDDIFLQESSEIYMKLGNQTYKVTDFELSSEDINNVISQTTNTSIVAGVREGRSVAFAFSVPWFNKQNVESRVRFRGNGTKTIGKFGSSDGMTFSIRRLGEYPPSMDDLKVPQGIRDCAFPLLGIVWVTGETGSGKTNLIGSLMRHESTLPTGKVITTYEHPVEFDLRQIPNRVSLIGQTDLNDALGTFADACKDAMRRNSDIILVGETRDKASAKGVINLAQTGHRVYTTLHAGTTDGALSRIINMFEADEQTAIRDALIDTTQAIITQRLITTKDGKRIPIQSWLKFTPSLKKELYQSNAETFLKVINKLYLENGHTMAQDILEKRDYFTEETFDFLWGVYGDGRQL